MTALAHGIAPSYHTKASLSRTQLPFPSTVSTSPGLSPSKVSLRSLTKPKIPPSPVYEEGSTQIIARVGIQGSCRGPWPVARLRRVWPVCSCTSPSFLIDQSIIPTILFISGRRLCWMQEGKRAAVRRVNSRLFAWLLPFLKTIPTRNCLFVTYNYT